MRDEQIGNAWYCIARYPFPYTFLNSIEFAPNLEAKGRPSCWVLHAPELGDACSRSMHGLHRHRADDMASGCRWSTIAILFANSLIFLFTYALRFREKAIVTANLAAIREDLKRQDSIHATLLLLQQQVSEMREEVATQHLPWRRTSGGARDFDDGKVAEALLVADSGAVGGSTRGGAVDTLSSGVVGIRPSALGASGIASVSPAATGTCPTAHKGKNHESRTTAAGGGDDGVQRAQSGWKAEGSRKTMLLGWYVGAACLASWAVGRAMPYAGS